MKFKKGEVVLYEHPIVPNNFFLGYIVDVRKGTNQYGTINFYDIKGLEINFVSKNIPEPDLSVFQYNRLFDFIEKLKKEMISNVKSVFLKTPEFQPMEKRILKCIKKVNCQ